MKNLEDLINKFNMLGIKEQIDYEKFYLYSIITHSTAIEGSTVSEVENQLLFDEGIVANKPMIEQLMNLDLKKAYERGFLLAKNHQEITKALLCELSALVMKNTGSIYKSITGDFDSSRGELRLVNVSAGRGGKSYLKWEKIESELEKFCLWLNEERKNIDEKAMEKIYELSFEAHYRLVSIHPWVDGNGRISRLVMNMLQVEFNLIPSILKKENKAEYIETLALAQDKGDSLIFIEFMKNNHYQNLEQQIIDFQKSM